MTNIRVLRFRQMLLDPFVLGVCLLAFAGTTINTVHALVPSQGGELQKAAQQLQHQYVSQSPSAPVSTSRAGLSPSVAPPLSSRIPGHPPLASTTSRAAAARMTEEENEWYTPPPAPVQSTQIPTEITVVNSDEAWRTFLALDDDRLCVISFHASWCKSCQKFGLLYKSLAHKLGDKRDRKTQNIVERGSVRFASVEWGANTALCRSLGIKRLPTTQIYHAGTLLTSFACAPAKFQTLKDQIKYMTRTLQNSDRLAAIKANPLFPDEQAVQDKVQALLAAHTEQEFSKTLDIGAALIDATVMVAPPSSDQSDGSNTEDHGQGLSRAERMAAFAERIRSKQNRADHVATTAESVADSSHKVWWRFRRAP
jgi:thioredoxin-like negative regulator of GroEL